PWAMHTFDVWDYDPVAKKLLAVGSPKHAYQVLEDLQRKGLLTGALKPATWWYDPDHKHWELLKIPTPDLFAFGLVWDPLGRQFIGHDGRSTYHYHVEHKEWVTYPAASSSGWHRRMVFDTFTNRVLTLGHNGGSDILYSYDPKTHDDW